MKNISIVIISIIVFSFSSLSFSAETAEKKPGLISSVFQTERSDKEDVIYLRNKDIEKGTVLNETLTMTTPYGEVTVELRKCAGISFEGSRANTESLVTVNYNRITGILKDAEIIFKIGSSGEEIKIRKEKIKFILLKKTANELDFVDIDSKPDLFIMANGDLLTGEAVDPKVKVRTDYGDKTISFPEMKTLEMQGGENVITLIIKKDGGTTRGTLLTEEITLKLDSGSEVKNIYKDKFSKIYVDDGITQAASNFGILQPIGGESEGALVESEPIGAGKEVIENSIGMKLRLIPAGEFMMGSEKGQNDEKPVHKVKITKPFYIGVYEVTQAQYEKIMGANPSEFSSADRPVEKVSWNDAKEFCKKLSQKEGVTYRLPTEAEWEYACRAGTKTEYYWGDAMDGRYAVYRENSGNKTQKVGTKEPNKWGLYDMSGNVWEWCEDWYGDIYSGGEETDPIGATKGEYRVLRGGSWLNYPEHCRSAIRGRDGPSLRYFGIGFRVVRSASNDK